MTTIKNQFISIKNRIEEVQKAVKLPANSVQLLVVSKTWPSTLLRELAEAGQRCFGENYLQEALVKINELTDLDLEWHFIGPIQSNKTRDIAQHFDWVQSVDRIKIAQRLANQRPEKLADLNVCIQVNIDNEASKSGVLPADLMEFANQIDQIERLSLRGLMIIPAKTDDPKQQNATFEYAHQLFSQLAKHFTTVDTLSMGMSADMEAAIAQGSTMVRLGTAVFGQRVTGQVH